MQPLSGLLVLDFTTLLPGPLATLMLAEAGAEVIKIERPGGEDMRAYPPRFDGVSAAFAMLNRGKQSLVLDLRKEEERQRLMPLLSRADVLVEQFRPGVMERLGLGYAAVAAINPRLVYCSITGYGQEGPRAGEAGHDLNYIGNTGLLALQPGPSDRPVVPPALVADIAGGSFPAVMNILLALRQRDATGQGCRLDIAMADAMFTFAWYALAVGHATGRFPGPGERDARGRLAALPALSDPRRQARRLRGARAEILARVRGRDRPCAELVDDRIDPAATQAAVAAIIAAETADHWRPAACRRRLLRHHRGVARGGARRSAFRRARPVRPFGRGRERRRPCRRCRCRSTLRSANPRAA